MGLTTHNLPADSRSRPRRALLALSAISAWLSLVAPGDAQDQTVQPTAVPAHRQADTIGVLTVEGEVDSVTLFSLERRLARALKEGAEAIVIELDTPGGDMYTTLDICNMIKADAPANTVAWVHPEAYSAGTIMALACREIVVSPNSTFGDAAPIQAPMGVLINMPAAERAKTEATLLEEVIDSARRNHYDENLVKSFVSVGVELWLIEHLTTGERVFVHREEFKTLFGEEPPTQALPVAPPPGVVGRGVTPTERRLFGVIPVDEPGEDQVEPPTPEEIAQQIEDAQDRPPLRQPLTAEDRGDWKLVGQVIGPDQLLTLKPAEAIYFGLATTTIANDDELKAFFGATSLARYDASWSEGLVRFMISWPVRAVLLVVFLLALFIELSAPGLGVFGATAFVAILLLIGAPYLAGMAQWWDILLIVVGVALVLVELFVLPGMGVAGIAGAVCLLVGLIGSFVSSDLGSSEGQSQLLTGTLTTLTAIFAAGAGMWLISRQMHSMPVLGRMILNTEVGERETAAPGLLESMGGVTRDAGVRPGDVGTAETDLKPSGRAMFEGRMYEVTAIGDFVDRGARVRVLAVKPFGFEVEAETT